MGWKLAFPSVTVNLYDFVPFRICRILHYVSVWFYFSLCMKKLCPINEGMSLFGINEALRISLFRNYQLGLSSTQTTMNEIMYWIHRKLYKNFFWNYLKYCKTFCLTWINKVLASHCLITYCRLVWIWRQFRYIPGYFILIAQRSLWRYKDTL